MKKVNVVGITTVLALTGWLVASVPALSWSVDEAGSAPAAGTWEDDCNLSKRNPDVVAAKPGSPNTARWTRTAISYHDRACRQVAASELPSIPLV